MTDYGLDGQGIEFWWGEIFHPPRLALGPNQPPVQWVLGPSGGKEQPGHDADPSPPSSAAIMEEWGYTSTHPLGHYQACNGNTLPLPSVRCCEDLELLFSLHCEN